MGPRRQGKQRTWNLELLAMYKHWVGAEGQPSLGWESQAPPACGTARDRNDAAEARATLPIPSLAPRAVLTEALSPVQNPPSPR